MHKINVYVHQREHHKDFSNLLNCVGTCKLLGKMKFSLIHGTLIKLFLEYKLLFLSHLRVVPYTAESL